MQTAATHLLLPRYAVLQSWVLAWMRPGHMSGGANAGALRICRAAPPAAGSGRCEGEWRFWWKELAGMRVSDGVESLLM